MARSAIAAALLLTALALAPVAAASSAVSDAPPLVGIGGPCSATVVHVGCGPHPGSPTGLCVVYWGLNGACIVY